MIDLPNGVDINNLIDDLINFSWEAADILLKYSDIIRNSEYIKWKLGKQNNDCLQIESSRNGDNPGTHSVNYLSKVDEISIKHEAFKRDGFALGAIIAAEWLIDKKGVFSMDDVLQI